METTRSLVAALLAATILAACGGGGGSVATTTDTAQTPVWQDEFNGKAVDAGKWSAQIGNGIGSGAGYVSGWGNNELEYYTDRAENLKVEDGNLVITARKEAFTGDANGTATNFTWTSARIRTAGKFSRTYGKFEIRAKLPRGKGLWPAIWMLPEDQAGTTYGTWAANGEIDIMEGWGSKPTRTGHTIHYGGMWPNNVYSGKEVDFPNAGSIDQWHVYTLEWRSNEIRWYVDGQLVSTKTEWWSSKAMPPTSDADLNAWPAPFDKPFHLLLNLAVGGNFDGNPDATTPDTAQMLVDYVRVYSLPDEARSPGTRPSMTYPWTPKPARAALADGNLIYNGGFDWAASDSRIDASTASITGASSSHFWLLYTSDGAATVSNDAGALKTEITQPGSVNYAVQVRQDGINLVNLKRYQVKFKAWASSPRKLMLKIGGGPDRGYAAYSGEQVITLGTTPNAQQSLSFDMFGTTDAAARFELNLGNEGANTVWVDDIEVKEIGDVPIRAALPDGNLIYNGSFSDENPSVDGIAGANNTDYWSFWESGANGAAASVTGGALKLAVAHVDPANNWHIQLMQKKLPLISGQRYTLSFKGRATDARTVRVVVGEDGGSYARYLDVDAALTSSDQTLTWSFTAPVTNYSAQVQILGAVGAAGSSYDLVFDDFRLQKN
ncbi:MAG: hypothetical protein RJA63_1763 [Pseudomonadota bacterium]